MPKPETFRWSTRAEDAVRLLAEDRLSDEAIAKEVGVSKRTIIRWKQEPEFAARLREYVDKSRAAVLESAIADYRYRVAKMAEIFSKMERLIEERKAMYADISDTGLIVKQIKVTKEGDQIDEYAFDAALTREMRQYLAEIESQLGQKVDKKEIRGEVEVKRLIGVSLDEI